MKCNLTVILIILLVQGCSVVRASVVDKQPCKELLDFVQAVSANDTNTVNNLIAKGVDVNQHFGALSETPLFRAAMWGHNEVASLLLASGADPLATNRWGNTPFQIAAARGHRGVAETLLDRGAQLDARDALGRTALFMAAKEGSEETALWLLDLGADSDVRPKDSSETVMFHAAFNGMSKLIRVLGTLGARSDGTGYEGWSPLHVATMRGNVESVKALLQAGAAADPLDKLGRTPFLLGVDQGQGNQAAIVDLLAESGADLTKTDKRGRSALDYSRRRKEKAERRTDEPYAEYAAEIARLDAMMTRILHHLDHPSKGDNPPEN